MWFIKFTTKLYFSIIGAIKSLFLKKNVAYKTKYRPQVIFHFIGRDKNVFYFIFDRYTSVGAVVVTETNTTKYDSFWKLGIMRFKKI